MKCKHCGGSIVHDPGNCASPVEIKCLSCGRRVMEEKKMKMCLRCNENFEATADNFYRRSASKDGLEPYCKRCKNKMADGDTTATKKRKPPHNKNARRRGQDAINRLRPHPNLLSHRLMTAHKKSLTMASPEAIIAALRKGVAREIIKLIEEKFA